MNTYYNFKLYNMRGPGKMDQNLSLYRIFYTVANTQNISKAASELFISQPAISKSLRKLEENLNLSLFIRNSRGVTLTSEGKTLYTYVSQAFDALQTGEEKLRQIQELGIGHIRIGVSSTLCKFTLLPYLEDFIKTHPHIRITIECQSTSHTLSLLRENKIDLGLIGRPESLLHLHFDSLGEIEDIFVATGTYLSNLTLRSADGNADIFKNATLMLLDKGNITRQYIDDYLVLNHIETGNVLEISTMDLLIEFAKISLGVACVIKQFVQNELSSGELLEIPLEYPIRKREIGFAYPRQAGQSGAVQKFIDFCLRDKP